MKDSETAATTHEVHNAPAIANTAFTHDLQVYLSTPRGQRSVIRGATLYLQLTHNRVYYDQVRRHPARHAADLMARLKNQLMARLDGRTRADVERLQRVVTKRAMMLPPKSAVREELRALSEVRTPKPPYPAVYYAARLHDVLRRLATERTDHSKRICDVYEWLTVFQSVFEQYTAALERENTEQAAAAQPAEQPAPPRPDSIDSIE